MANTNKKNKNKPGFFSLLITVVFIAASVFGVYKVMTYVESNPKPVVDETIESTGANTDVTAVNNADAAAVAEKIAALNADISADILTYCAENFETSALEAVLKAVEDGSYTDETWYTATGYSVYSLADLASGAVESGAVRDMGSNGTDSFELVFAGDVCFDESIPNMQKLSETGDIANCISNELLTMMNEADITMVNNEFTFSDSETPADKRYTFKTDAENVELYAKMGVDVVSLANNHSFDFGEESFTDTAKTLTDAKIAYTGAGLNAEDAAKPAYFIVNGRKIAFVAACDTVYAKSTAASAASSGVFSIRNLDAVCDTIKAADAVSDYVVIYNHWGHENSAWFSSDPNVSDQQGWGKEMIKAGADAVIGAHPHVLQGMEYYDGKLIAYSLGNFWFNGKTMDTGLVKIKISNLGEMQCSFVPCVQTDGTVSMYTDAAERRRIFDYIFTQSGGYVTLDDDGVITAVRDTAKG